MTYNYYVSSFGSFLLEEENGRLCSLTLTSTPPKEMQATPLTKQTKQQLNEYLQGQRQQFTIPLSLKGSTFQQKVWLALQTIPYGETRTYQQIAQQIGCPKGCRAVGNANNKNPIPIIIPCHRVIKKNGSLSGYILGVTRKEQLLTLEKEKANNDENDE